MTKPDTGVNLGSVRCNLRGAIRAGSWQTCRLTYTAGIDDTGSLKIVMRYVTDCGTPQFSDPVAANYTTAEASNGAKLELRFDPKDNLRPWGRTLRVKVLQGFLKRGETITLTLGDRSEGSPGWRVQTFVARRFQLKVLVDPYATVGYRCLEKSPGFRIVAGEPVRLVAVAPSRAKTAHPIRVRWKFEDAWGNPVGRAQKMRHPGFATPGPQVITVHDEKSGLSGESNPVMIAGEAGYGHYWADLHGQSEETVGTGTIEEYFRFGRDHAFLDICAHQGNDFQITDAFWKTIQKTTRQFYAPGRYVTFPGWEWSGNTGLGGDRNVLFRREGGPIHRSSRALVTGAESSEPIAETVEDLFDRLQDTKPAAMVIAHVGGRYADLKRHREGLECAVEVHSAWGTFEWMLEDAFRFGYRVAIVANSDGHKGRPGASYPGASTFGSYGGLTCVLAKSLDRASVWEAYARRRVYASTGARILLDLKTSTGAEMGDVVAAADGIPRFDVSVHGTAAIERVELRNGMDVLKTFRPYGQSDLSDRIKLTWEGATVRGRGRQVNWDGGLKIVGNKIAGFTPINFYNIEKSCQQVGIHRLEWESITTGGVAGVVVRLARGPRGRAIVKTPHGRFQADLGRLGLQGRRWALGGLARRVSLYRLPAADGQRKLSFSYQPKPGQLHRGDNPLYIHVLQEDGHMAWSSPVYVVGKT